MRADDDDELALVGDAPLDGRDLDGVAGPDDGGVGLEEDQRVLGRVDVRGHVLPVLGVVQADAHHLRARDHRSEQLRVGERDAFAGRAEALEDRIAREHDQLVVVDDAEPGVSAVDAEPGDLHRSTYWSPATAAPASLASIHGPALGRTRVAADHARAGAQRGRPDGLELDDDDLRPAGRPRHPDRAFRVRLHGRPARRACGARRPRPSCRWASTGMRWPRSCATAGSPVLIGGKSYGGRVASLVADELHDAGAVSGLVCLGYPFHPPEKPEAAAHRAPADAADARAHLPGHPRPVRRRRTRSPATGSRPRSRCAGSTATTTCSPAPVSAAVADAVAEFASR